MDRRSTVIVGVALAVVIGLVLATVSPGRGSAWAAEPRTGPRGGQTPSSHIPAAVRARMLAQQPLTRAASRIRWAVERSHASGLAGIALQAGTVAVWWKGAPPAAVARAIAAAGRSVPVRLHPARYSLAELRAASDGVVAAMRANPAGPLHTMEIPVDGSGLVVGADRGAALGAAPYLARVPVPVKVVSRPRGRLLSRGADTPPFWGGARIRNADNGHGCTSGFGVTDGSTRYLLTAGHCGRPGGGWYNGDGSRFIGTATLERVDHDLLLIPADVGGRIYVGSAGNSELSEGVAGWDWAIPGEYVCQSGFKSGEVCNLQNSNDFSATICDNDTYGNYECASDLILAQRVDGGTAALPGDSGGPVFTLASNNNVVAKGIMSAAGGASLWYQDFGTAWRDFGIVPLNL